MARKKFKKSSNMKKAISTLQSQMESVVKTFEQRQFDFLAPAAPTYDGMPLLYSTPVVLRGSDLYPTVQDPTGIAPASTTAAQIRLGDKITLKSMDIRGEIRACQSSGAAAERTNIVRLILVKFIDSVVSLTNAEIVSAVLQQYPTQTGTAINSIQACYSSLKNVLTQENNLPIRKYKRIYDKTFLLTNPFLATASGDEPWRRRFEIKKSWKEGLVNQYGKFLNTQADLNQVVLIALSDSTVAPHPDFTLVSRVKYMDA